MDNSIPIGVVLCWISAFCGGLAGFILLFGKGRKVEANRYLALFYLFFSFTIFIGSFAFNDLFLRFPNLFRLDSPFTYALIPMLFLFVKSSTEQDFKLRKWYWLLVLPAGANLIEFIPLYFSSTEEKLVIIQRYADKGNYLLPFHFPAKALWLGIFISADMVLIYKYWKNDPATLQKFAPFYRWMGWFHFYFILLFLFQISLVAGLHFENWNPYFISYFSQACFVLISTIGLFFFPEILYGLMPKQKRNYLVVSENLLRNGSFDSLVRSTQEKRIFLNAKLTLNELAKEMKMNSRQLSQVIKHQSGFEFRDFVNQQRVIYIKNVLATQPQKLQTMTIAALAEEAGFSSRAAFYNAFRKFAGTTPKEYLKQLDPKISLKGIDDEAEPVRNEVN